MELFLAFLRTLPGHVKVLNAYNGSRFDTFILLGKVFETPRDDDDFDENADIEYFGPTTVKDKLLLNGSIIAATLVIPVKPWTRTVAKNGVDTTEEVTHREFKLFDLCRHLTR